MDRLDAMEVFARVAELGSFTKAAAALRLPRSTVTAALQMLEARLGMKLLHRTTRQVSLTAEGEAYLKDVRRVLEDVEGIEAELGRRTGSPRGRVVVDVTAAAGRHVLAPALPSFFEQYPEVTLELGSTDRPVDLLAEGVDCVLRGGDVHDESLVGKRLASFPVFTLGAPAYLEARGVPATPDDLEAHWFVGFTSPRTRRTFPPELESDGVTWTGRPRHRVAANDADTWLAAVVAGLGLAQVPCTRNVLGHLESGALVRVLPDWSAGELPLHVLWPRERKLPLRVRAFVDWVTALYAEEQREVEARLRALTALATRRRRRRGRGRKR